MYFDDKDLKKKVNEIKSDDSKGERLDKLDDDKYNEYGRYNKYNKHNKGYYYSNRRYEKRGSPIMSPIILSIIV